jgi:hypothetical protein
MGLDMFAYVAAFVSIVLALALGDLVQSLHRLLRARAVVRWHALPLVAAGFVFLSVLSEFFSLWQFRDLEALSFFGLVGLMSVATLVALAACAALPDDVPTDGLDLRVFYLGNRRYLYVVLALAYATDFARTTVLYWTPGEDALHVARQLALRSTSGAIIATLILLAWTPRRWVHVAGMGVLLVLAYVGFAQWTIRQPPVAPVAGSGMATRA